MTEIKIQNGCLQKKARQKICTKESAKTVLQCRILKASKTDGND